MSTKSWTNKSKYRQPNFLTVVFEPFVPSSFTFQLLPFLANGSWKWNSFWPRFVHSDQRRFTLTQDRPFALRIVYFEHSFFSPQFILIYFFEVFATNGTVQEKPCIKVLSSTWLNHPTNKNQEMSFAYAFCQYQEIFINQYSELVSYPDAVAKCGAHGLAWPHELKLRKGI